MNAGIIRTHLDVDDNKYNFVSNDDSGSGSDSTDLHDYTTDEPTLPTNNNDNDLAVKKRLSDLLGQLGTGNDAQVAKEATNLLANFGSNASNSTNKGTLSEPSSNHSNGRLIQTTAELSFLSQSDSESISDYGDKTEAWETMHGALVDRRTTVSSEMQLTIPKQWKASGRNDEWFDGTQFKTREFCTWLTGYFQPSSEKHETRVTSTFGQIIAHIKEKKLILHLTNLSSTTL